MDHQSITTVLYVRFDLVVCLTTDPCQLDII